MSYYDKSQGLEHGKSKVLPLTKIRGRLDKCNFTHNLFCEGIQDRITVTGNSEEVSALGNYT
jgi:hypothetical protein